MNPFNLDVLAKDRILQLQTEIARERLKVQAAQRSARPPSRRVLRLLGSKLIHLGERLQGDPQPAA